MNKGTTYKRKDGRWECRISMGKNNDGKRIFKSFYGKSREEAEYKSIIAQNHGKDEYSITEMTVRELTTEWLHVMSSRIKESTSANYAMKIEKHILPTFGDMPCHTLKPKDIYDFIERKKKDGLSMRYLSDIIVLLKSVFRYAAKEYQIKNGLDGIVLPKKTKPEIDIMSKEQQICLEKYLKEHPSYTSLGISLSIYTGLRIGEICALQWEDIDLEKRTLTIKKTIQRVQCQTKEHRTKIIITDPKSEFYGIL